MTASRAFNRVGLVVAAGMLSAALIPGMALAADKPADSTPDKPAASAPADSEKPADSTKADATATAEETWAYGFVFNDKDSGVGIIYYASPYFELDDIVNPATGEPYTSEEVEAIFTDAESDDAKDKGYVAAPKDAFLGMTIYDGNNVFWYDKDAAREIVSHADALTLDSKTGELADADGKVIAKPMETAALTYADGTYEASAEGMGGEVPVTVTIKDGKIASVEIGDNAETQGIGSNAIEQLPELIVAANGTAGVDAVSGATVTSSAIFAAVNEALDEATVVTETTDDTAASDTDKKDSDKKDDSKADTSNHDKSDKSADKDSAK